VTHDARSRPADQGGPFVDLDGNVLGLNVARAGRTETWGLLTARLTPLSNDLKARKDGDRPRQ